MRDPWVRYSNLDIAPRFFRDLVKRDVPGYADDLYGAPERIGDRVLRLARKHKIVVEVIFSTGRMEVSISTQSKLNIKEKRKNVGDGKKTTGG